MGGSRSFRNASARYKTCSVADGQVLSGPGPVFRQPSGSVFCWFPMKVIIYGLQIVLGAGDDPIRHGRSADIDSRSSNPFSCRYRKRICIFSYMICDTRDAEAISARDKCRDPSDFDELRVLRVFTDRTSTGGGNVHDTLQPCLV